MNEKELNRIIARTFNAQGFGYKIPDPSWPGAKSPKRPFDGFAVNRGWAIYWEAKFLRGYQRLALDRIDEHQLESLRAVHAPGCGRLGVVAVGINTPRKGTDLFFLDIRLIDTFCAIPDFKSIPAEMFKGWRADGQSVPIKKGTFELPGDFNEYIIREHKSAVG